MERIFERNIELAEFKVENELAHNAKTIRASKITGPHRPQPEVR